MKLKSALLALASTAMITTAAHANSYANGDLILGMYDTSGTYSTSYEVDLGSISTFEAASSPVNFSLGTDLNNFFGSSWPTTNGSTPVWAVGGTTYNTANNGFAADTLFLSSPETAAYNDSPITPVSNQGNQASEIYNMGHFLGQSTDNATTTDAVDVADTNGNSFDTRVNAAAGQFDEGTNAPNGVVNGFTNGVAGSVSDLDILTQSGTETTLGSFAFNSAGTLTFTPAAVPEPSSYALGAVAMLLFLVLKRRQSVKV